MAITSRHGTTAQWRFHLLRRGLFRASRISAPVWLTHRRQLRWSQKCQVEYVEIHVQYWHKRNYGRYNSIPKQKSMDLQKLQRFTGSTKNHQHDHHSFYAKHLWLLELSSAKITVVWLAMFILQRFGASEYYGFFFSNRKKLLKQASNSGLSP